MFVCVETDGDELVVLRVLDPSTSSTSFTKSSLSDLAKEEAHHLLRLVAERNSTFNSDSASTTHFHHSNAHEITDSHGNISIDSSNNDLEPINEIGITIEHVIGRVQDSIQKVIKVYRPDSLIVGTRGRSDSILKSAFIGSVSRYCVAK
jgi:flagellar motor switch/type III secretory pathway protein FliN